MKHRAYRIRDHQGQRFYRVPVVVRLNDSRSLGSQLLTFSVIAESAPAAANWVRDYSEYATRAETEIYAYGPRGGETYRYIGWDSAVGAAMLSHSDAHKQGELTL